MRAFTYFLAATTLATFAVPSLATDYPLKIDNCGMALTIEQAPNRVVAIKSTAADLLLALGLEDKLVGLAFLDGPLLEPYSASNYPILSEKLPSQEVVLETEPDFIYGGWESNFSADGAGERPALQELGITSYVAPAACRSVKPEKLSFDQLFGEITEMGAIFGVDTTAKNLIEDQKAALAGVKADDRGLTALWYSSGTKTPYVGAGSNAPEMILDALGLKNIFADVDEGWTQASWEAIVDANPDVIVLVDAAWNSAEAKKKLLAENPITSKMDAVINGRYLIIPFPASEAGVRNVPATVDLAGQLAGLSF